VTNSASNCLTCQTAGNLPQNGVCQAACTGTATLDSGLNVCYTCNANCLDCDHILTSVCKTCAANLNLNPASKTCVSNCPLGSYAQNNVCNPCPLGCTSCQYQASTTSVVCSGCNAGYFPQGASCIPCKAGCATCTSASSCSTCSPDYYLSQSTCYIACLPGYVVSGVGSFVCQPCSSGCISCIQGFGLNSGNCATCDVNNGYSSDGTTDCAPCLSNCVACINGYSYDAGSFTCTQCPAGSVAASSASTCTVCSNGMVPNADNSLCVPCTTGCSVCIAGYQLAGSTCSKCNNGFVSKFGGSCTSCPFNLISNLGNTQCVQCAQAGFLPNADQSACVPCTIECLVCPINYGYSTSDNTCTICNSNSVSDGTQLCSTCQPGQVQGSIGTCVNCLTQCLLCVPGYGYNAISQVCTQCSPGYFSPGGNAICQKCPT
jgi:proprotein convertase subtilisin/kexin type 5